MGNLNIGLSPAADREKLLAFLARHWGAEHVFVKAPELLDWQHLSADGASHNYVVGTAHDETAGVLGFIPQSRFDPALAAYRHLFLAIWKVDEGTGAGGIGLLLLSRLRQICKPTFIGAVGLSDMVTAIYKELGYTQGRLDHHVLFDPGRRDFRIAQGVPEQRPPVPQGTKIRLEPMDEAGLLNLPSGVDRCFENTVPRKSRLYLANRYLRHPYYSYRLFAVRTRREVTGFIVMRRVEAMGAHALRIIDFVGDQTSLQGLGTSLVEQMRSVDAEYLDFYSHGMSPESLFRAGFVDRYATEGLTIPNYFEPFVGENKDLAFAYKCFGGLCDPVVLVRGDSDQDRPNQVPLPQSQSARTGAALDYEDKRAQAAVGFRT